MTSDGTPTISRTNPPELGSPPGYSQIVEISAGRILFISSESAVYIPTEMIHYGMTKTAQLAISRGRLGA